MNDDYEYDVFVSYDSQDKTTQEIAERLRSDGVRVWFAPWCIRAGDHFRSRIEDGLRKSRRIACFMTARAYASGWVTVETGHVLSFDPDNSKRRLIPVQLDPALSDSLLSQLHCIKWHDDPERAYADLLALCRDHADVSSAPLEPAATGVPSTFREILALCNRAALSLFDEYVRGLAGTGEAAFPRDRHIIAGRYWGDAEYEAQRRYVQLRLAETPEFVQQKARQLLQDSFRSGTKTRLWIVGEAGTGKTTWIYRLYFEMIQALDRAERDGQDTPYPVPMLFQPQKMDQKIIDRLRATESETDFVVTLFEIWLERRQFEVPRAQRARVQGEFLDALRRGTVVLLIDSYDELGRMDIQLDMFRHLFNAAKHYVCATRPEMYTDAPEHQPLRISSTWDVPTIRDHVERVFPEAPEVAYVLARYIAGRHKVRWLRNPRYLDLLIRFLRTRIRMGDVSTRDVLEVIEEGQYKLLDYFYKATIQRLYAIAPNHGVSLDGGSFEWEVRRRLQAVARSQMETGTLQVTGGLDELWILLATNASEIVARRMDYASSDEHFYLVSYNWIDFFLVDIVIHDLFAPPSMGSLPHLWTQTLLTYAAEVARNHPEAATFPSRIRDRLSALRDAARGETRRNADINLVQLLVRIAAEQGETPGDDPDGHSHDSCFEDEDFSRLDLDSIDLHRLRFRRCDFSETRLTRANLERAEFEACDFSYADLRHGNADHATFIDCTFTLGSDSATVAGLSMQGATVTDGGHNRLETFKRLGAIMQRSRYQSPFGKLFFERQRQMLGPGLARAEQVYLREIRAALDARPGGEKHLVDLMAGGGNKRLIDLLERDASLRVLAIDRDGRDMNEIVGRVGARFAMVEKEIAGRTDFNALLEATFDVRAADLVIGKKAIHEIPRDAQILLVASAAEVLHEGGRLILFTDSPYQTDEAGRERLAALRNLLIAYEDRDLDALRDELLALSFDAASQSDLAVFSNLWVHLKDWANGNEQELRNRYFSGAQEVRAWAEEAGLRQVGDGYADHYQLVARRFNEAGFNQVCHRMEESRNIIHDRDIGFYRDKLEGSERFRLFCEVVERHLWDAASEQPTTLGAALHARAEPIRFHELNPALQAERLGLSYDRGIGFDFTIHVLAFERERVS